MNINNLFETRRTIRKFQQIPIPQKQLYTYIDNARLAPSAGNIQPLKYAVIDTEEMTEKIFGFVKWAAYLAPAYNPKEDERPTAYIVICADESIASISYETDAGLATGSIIISAWSDGVGTCLIGAIDRPRITEFLGLPNSMKVVCVIALGYPKEEPEHVSVKDGDIKYYLNDNGRLCVPKRDFEEILISKETTSAELLQRGKKK